MANKHLKLALGVALMLAGQAAYAQFQSAVPVPIRPAYAYPESEPATGAASIRVGDSPLYIAPFLAAGLGHDDNLFYSNVDKKGSNIYVISPGFRIDGRSDNAVFGLNYQNSVGRYTSSTDDDYVDNIANATVDLAFSRRAFMRLGWDELYGHDPRGSTDRGIATHPDKYRQEGPNVTLAYGTPGAKGRVEGYFSNLTRSYTNNRATTIGSDRSVQEFGGAFYWRVMPKTQVLLDVRRTDQSYDLPGSPFSSSERRVYAGVTWEATAQTSGTIKVGSLKKDFESDLPDFSTTGWEGLITWAPRTYSKLDFYSARYPMESTGLGSFILADASGVSWTHAWNSVFTTGVNLRYERDRYQGFDRNDDSTSVGLKAGYRFRRWLTIGAEYTHTNRNSNLDFYDFDRNFYLLTVTGTM